MSAKSHDAITSTGFPPDCVEMQDETFEQEPLQDDVIQHNNDDDDKYETRDTQCGVGSCRPRAVRPLGSIWAFTAVLSVGTVLANMNFAYYSAVITQIERRFGLSSSMTGFIKNVDNIGFMLTVITVSHLARNANKPRVLAISSFLSGLSIFLFAVPHFMYGGPSTSFSLPATGNSRFANQTQVTSSRTMFDMCKAQSQDELHGNGEHKCLDGRSSSTQMVEFHGGALALFVLSELFQGMAISPKTTLSLTYMDDNAKNKSPQYFGFMFGMRAFAPMIGFLMGAWTNSIYVDLTATTLMQEDKVPQV